MQADESCRSANDRASAMSQTCRISCSLASNISVILLDEPVGHLLNLVPPRACDSSSLSSLARSIFLS